MVMAILMNFNAQQKSAALGLPKTFDFGSQVAAIALKSKILHETGTVFFLFNIKDYRVGNWLFIPNFQRPQSRAQTCSYRTNVDVRS